MQSLILMDHVSLLNTAANIGSHLDSNFTRSMVLAFVISSLIIAAITILCLCATCEIFRKLGEKKCWKALIPFYNIYILYKKIWTTKAFWVTVALYVCAQIIFIIGLFNIVFFAGLLVVGLAILIIKIISLYYLSKAFGQSIGYFIGLILLPVIFICILAFGKSKYKK